MQPVLVATWHSSQDNPVVIGGHNRKPRRWRVYVWASDTEQTISETILPDKPVYLHEILKTTLETARELQAEMPGMIQAGFDIHRLKRR